MIVPEISKRSVLHPVGGATSVTQDPHYQVNRHADNADNDDDHDKKDDDDDNDNVQVPKQLSSHQGSLSGDATWAAQSQSQWVAIDVIVIVVITGVVIIIIINIITKMNSTITVLVDCHRHNHNHYDSSYLHRTLNCIL